MTAYLIASIVIENAEAYAEYKQRVPQTIAKYSGRYLVRGGEGEILEGNWSLNRLVVLEFPDINALKTWYNSEDYKELKAMRQSNASTNIVSVEGVSGFFPERRHHRENASK